MRKFILALLLTIITSLGAFASNADLFSYDEEKVTTEFNSLSSLENYITEKSLTYIDLQKDPFLAHNLEELNLSAHPSSPNWSFETMDWGAFAWGFCCWPIGIFTVILNDSKDSDSKLSYLIGVGTAFIFSAPVYYLRRGWYY